VETWKIWSLHIVPGKRTKNIHAGRKNMADETVITPEQIASLLAQTFALVRACPEGSVTTYSWVGRALGYPRGARMIGWFMNEAEAGVPAQRVINSKGELSGSWAFGSPDKMRLLLEAEGVTFTDAGTVDLKRYGWDPSRDLSEEERARILQSADSSTAHPSPRLIGLLRYDAASPFKPSKKTS
jgi:methylated-DNA-protein-cysteine methyltransferase related protein